MAEKNSRYTLVFSEYFDIQLLEIYAYLAEIEYRPETAEKIISGVFQLIYDEIKYRPLAFPKSTGFKISRESYRQAVYKAWIITFKIEEERIEILSIVHGSRHPKRRISKR